MLVGSDAAFGIGIEWPMVRVLAHQDLFQQQAQDFLPLAYLQLICPQPQLGTETGECFHQAQAVCVVDAGAIRLEPLAVACGAPGIRPRSCSRLTRPS
jgi:hypothetical protein